jgi:magnesium chelatase family protein
VESYRSRISGPLLDRIDIMVEVPSVAFDDLRQRAEAEPSASIKDRVDRARQIQNRRYGEKSGMCNARMGPQEMRSYCRLDDASEALMQGAFERMGLTARSYDRILRVARTIADLEGSKEIRAHHLAEAVRYRTVKIANQN